MGSCISKCKPKKKFKEDPNRHVQDKLVISQDPPTISPVEPEKITIMPLNKPLSPAPSTSSTASFSSFSCSNTSKYVMASSISSSSSSSSYSSSVLMKDRSFSNDFLWSCAKENPHAVSLKENLDPSSLLASSPFVRKSKQIVREKMEISSTPKKRARASSPTLVRQKSFRKEQSYGGGAAPHRGLRSPSPSRRFNGESNRIFPNYKESCYRNQVVSRGINAVSSAPKRECFRAPIKEECVVRKNGGFSQHINSRIDEGVGKEIDVVMEDINNPLIALDCFIFL